MLPEELGWFADIADDEEQVLGFPWRVYLQLEGWCPSIDGRFASKTEAEDFIKKDIIGKQMLHAS